MKESFIRIEGEELQVKGAHSVDHRVTPRAVPGTGAVCKVPSHGRTNGDASYCMPIRLPPGAVHVAFLSEENRTLNRPVNVSIISCTYSTRMGDHLLQTVG